MRHPVYNKETRTKLLAISPLPDLQTVTDLCRSEESAKLDDARISRQLNERRAHQSKFRRNFCKSKERNKKPCTKCAKRPAHQKVKPTVPQKIYSAQYVANKVTFHQCAFITNLGLVDTKK